MSCVDRTRLILHWAITAQRRERVPSVGSRLGGAALAALTQLLAQEAYCQTLPPQVLPSQTAPKVAAPVVLDDRGLTEATPIADPSDLDRIPLIGDASVRLMGVYYNKVYADELFIRGRASEAKAIYLPASKALDDTLVQSSLGGDGAYRMLHADIAYRLALIDAGADFWGGGSSLPPTFPNQHLVRMQSLLHEMQTVNDFITAQIQSTNSAQVTAGLIRADTNKAVADVKAYIPEKDLQRAVEDMVRAKVDAAADKKKAVETRIAAAATERASFMREADKAAASAASAINSAVVSALGVDPKLVDAVRTGDVREALLTELGNGVDQVALLGDLRDTAEDALELHEQVTAVTDKITQFQAYRETVSGYLSNLSDLRDVVQNPTRERLIAVGLQVLDANVQLPAPLLKIRDAVANNTPLDAALGGIVSDQLDLGPELARVQDAIAVVANWNDSKLLKDVSEQFFKSLASADAADEPRSASAMQETLEYGAITGDAQVQARTAKALLDLWPYSLYDSLPPPLQAYLQQKLGEAPSPLNASRTAQELATLAPDVIAGNLILKVGSQPTAVGPLRSLLWGVRGKPPDVPVAEAQAKFMRYIADVDSTSADMRRYTLAALPSSDMQELGHNLLTQTPNGNAIQAAVSKALSAEAKEEIARLTTATAIGSIVENAAGQSALAGPGPKPAGGSSDLGKMLAAAATKQIAQAALNAALPGLGSVAMAGGEYLNAVSAFDQAMSQAHDLDKEIESLTQQEIQLTAELNEATRSLGLLKAQAERDEVYREAALEQIKTLASVEDDALKQVTIGSLMIMRRAPRLFFYAEMLRREFDEFERSISLWMPIRTSARDGLRRLIASDPDYVRLVLDTDVHLFSWLDRDPERERGSADALTEHWSKLVSLAQRVCESANCPPITGQNTSFHVTASIDLSTLAGVDEWNRFKKWTATPKAEFPIHFVTAPGSGLSEIDGLTNVRLIKFSATAFDSRGNVINLPLRLKNSGSSIVRRDWGYEFETLPEAQQQVSSLNDTDLSDDNLSAAANAQSTASLTGYGAYANWQLVIPAIPVVKSISRIDVRLGYFYQSFADESAPLFNGERIVYKGGILYAPLTVTVQPIAPGKLQDCIDAWTQKSATSASRGPCVPMRSDYGLTSLTNSLSLAGKPATMTLAKP